MIFETAYLQKIINTTTRGDNVNALAAEYNVKYQQIVSNSMVTCAFDRLRF